MRFFVLLASSVVSLLMCVGCATTKTHAHAHKASSSSSLEDEGHKGAVTSVAPKVIVCTRALPLLLFEKDSAAISPLTEADLARYIWRLKEFPNDTTTIIGHTCSLGSAEYNLLIGTRRAESVKEHLMRHGIAPERIEIQSKGESAPIESNDLESRRRFNRRVEIIIHTAE